MTVSKAKLHLIWFRIWEFQFEPPAWDKEWYSRVIFWCFWCQNFESQIFRVRQPAFVERPEHLDARNFWAKFEKHPKVSIKFRFCRDLVNRFTQPITLFWKMKRATFPLERRPLELIDISKFNFKNLMINRSLLNGANSQMRLVDLKKVWADRILVHIACRFCRTWHSARYFGDRQVMKIWNLYTVGLMATL